MKIMDHEGGVPFGIFIIIIIIIIIFIIIIMAHKFVHTPTAKQIVTSPADMKMTLGTFSTI